MQLHYSVWCIYTNNCVDKPNNNKSCISSEMRTRNLINFEFFKNNYKFLHIKCIRCKYGSKKLWRGNSFAFPKHNGSDKVIQSPQAFSQSYYSWTNIYWVIHKTSWNRDNNLESLCRPNKRLQGYYDSKLSSGFLEGFMNYSISVTDFSEILFMLEYETNINQVI
jgi:hypothetical protein